MNIRRWTIPALLLLMTACAPVEIPPLGPVPDLSWASDMHDPTVPHFHNNRYHKGKKHKHRQ